MAKLFDHKIAYPAIKKIQTTPPNIYISSHLTLILTLTLTLDKVFFAYL